MPGQFKKALVRPSLKKLSLDASVKLNHRPVSNLSFLSKLLEKAVYVQLDQHLTANKLLPTTQCAYRKFHSTETCLLKMSNDILSALDKGMSTLLVTLDISAAFDTVDHQMLLSRYESRFGISGVPLAWMTCYLKNRSQVVQVGDAYSAAKPVETGFRQGSVLGEPKYNMHSSPLD